MFTFKSHAEVFAGNTCLGSEEFVHLLFGLALNVNQYHFELLSHDTCLCVSMLLYLHSHDIFNLLLCVYLVRLRLLAV